MAEILSTSNSLANTTGIASILGLSARRIQQLTQDGILVPTSRGKYEIGDTVQRYITYISKDKVPEDEAKMDKAKRAAEVTIKASKAKIAKLEADELEGKMHRSEDVEAMTIDLVFAVRSGLNALPGRLAMDVAGTTPAEASDIIRKEVNRLQEELSNYQYDPSKYEERVRQRRDWEVVDNDDDE